MTILHNSYMLFKHTGRFVGILNVELLKYNINTCNIKLDIYY